MDGKDQSKRMIHASGPRAEGARLDDRAQLSSAAWRERLPGARRARAGTG